MTAIEPVPAAARRKWLVAGVREIAAETPHVKTLWLDVPDWPGHLAGQHLDVRLTAEDGYQAQRSYSIASAPEEKFLSLTVEKVDGGEVSDYLTGDLRVGDKFEIRGPIGGYFVWRAEDGGPLLLIGGGSGIVPLMSMLRHRRNRKSDAAATLLYSARTGQDIIYCAELDALRQGDPNLQIIQTLTREPASVWPGHRGRIGQELISQNSPPPAANPKIYICGSNGFVETASQALIGLGYDALSIRTERFGPSGSASQ